MPLDLREELLTELASHGAISSAFRVERIIDLAGFKLSSAAPLVDRQHPAPFIKDYDTIAGNHPVDWAARFATFDCTLIAAYRGAERIGGAAVAVDSPTARLVDGDAGTAVLWDIRLQLASRGTGVGVALFRAAVRWAAARGCRQLKVETQDINVPACRLYSREGCRLESVEPGVYRDFPSEVRLLWVKPLME